jgi:hypothetical protein
MGRTGPKVTLEDPTTQTTDSTIATNSTIAEEEHPLVKAGQQATDTAGHLAARATDLGIEQADKGRGWAAEGIEHVAQGIRRLSTDLQVDQPAIAGAAETAADQAERVALYLRNNDAREMLSKVEDAARRQPLLFLGGAFVLGVAASRFLKAAGGPAGGSQALTGAQQRYGTAGDSSYGYRATGPGAAVGAERL